MLRWVSKYIFGQRPTAATCGGSKGLAQEALLATRAGATEWHRLPLHFAWQQITVLGGGLKDPRDRLTWLLLGPPTDRHGLGAGDGTTDAAKRTTADGGKPILGPLLATC